MYYKFSGSKCTHFIDSDHQCFLSIKALKIAFLRLTLKQKRICDRSNLCFCDTFRTFIPCSAIYFLEVIAYLSLKVATGGPFRCKETSKMSIFEAINLSKNEVVRSIYVFRKILERSNLVQLHIFCNRVHTFH